MKKGCKVVGPVTDPFENCKQTADHRNKQSKIPNTTLHFGSKIRFLNINFKKIIIKRYARLGNVASSKITLTDTSKWLQH